jgi:hypothetical protein
MDMTLGIDCVDTKEHNNWGCLRDTIVATISSGGCKLVVTVYPHILRQLAHLENDIGSPLLDPSVAVSLPGELDNNVKAKLLTAHIKDFPLSTESLQRLVEFVLQKDISGPVFGWCCNWMVPHWQSQEFDSTNIFLHPAEAYVPLLDRMLHHPSLGNALAAVLLIAMLGHTQFLHKPGISKESLRLLGFKPISDDELAGLADLLKGFVLNPNADDFASRVLYDAAGLALCRCHRMPALLTACDVMFLVQYVRTVETSSSFSATIKPRDADLLVDKLLLHIRKGQAPLVCQHPDLGSEKFLKQFEAFCFARKDEMENTMSVTDARYSLPLLYWSVWNPSPLLARWCFQFFAEYVQNGDPAGISLQTSGGSAQCPFKRVLFLDQAVPQHRDENSFSGWKQKGFFAPAISRHDCDRRGATQARYPENACSESNHMLH